MNGILESVLYADKLEKAERFYSEILGLPKIFAVPGRQLVFRCEESILLIFDPAQTEKNPITINGGAIPLHGSRGAGHVAFRIERNVLGEWRQRLQVNNVGIESEVSWPNGGHSIYFRDPAGNSIELSTPDMWKSK
jgi:catechol 2,3-dioxygenase-like lactoylglutathione lyase family enzyme